MNDSMVKNYINLAPQNVIKFQIMNADCMFTINNTVLSIYGNTFDFLRSFTDTRVKCINIKIPVNTTVILLYYFNNKMPKLKCCVMKTTFNVWMVSDLETAGTDISKTISDIKNNSPIKGSNYVVKSKI